MPPASPLREGPRMGRCTKKPPTRAGGKETQEKAVGPAL